MENILRLAREAVSDLEEYLPDLVDAIETEAERKTILSLASRLNKLARTIKDEAER